MGSTAAHHAEVPCGGQDFEFCAAAEQVVVVFSDDERSVPVRGRSVRRGRAEPEVGVAE